jgi:hypothetical protein
VNSLRNANSVSPFSRFQIPPEYLSLLRELSQAQQPQAQALQGGPPQAQLLAKVPQFEFPHDPQYGLGSQPQAHDPNIRYITEEEYLQLIKGHEQQQKQQQPQFIQVPQHSARPAGQQDSLGAYRTGEKSQGKHQQQQQQQQQQQAQHQQQRHQQPAQVVYKPASYKTQHPRPLADLSLEQELENLKKHNRPVVSFEPQQIVHAASPATPSHRQYVSQTPSPLAFITPSGSPYTQYHEQQYVAPVLRKPQQQVQQVAASAQADRKPKYESPAQKYQLIIPEEPIYKYSPQSQYYKAVAPQASALNSKLQYFAAKEKEQYRESQSQTEQLYSAPNAMKIVAPPQLQHEKPTARKPEEHQKKAHSRPQSQSSKHSQTRSKQANPSPHPQQKPSAVSYQPATKTDQKQYAEGPSKSAVYVSQSSGAEETIRVGAEGIPLPKSNRPLTQEEFQRLVDAGYSVIPVPVAIVNSGGHAPAPTQQQSPSQPHKYLAAPQRQTHQYRYLPQQQTAETGPVVTYLRPLSHE